MSTQRSYTDILEEMEKLKEIIKQIQKEKETNVPTLEPITVSCNDDYNETSSEYGKTNAHYQSLAFKQAFKGVLEFSGELMTEKGSVKAEDFIRSVEVALAVTRVPEPLAITYIIAKLKSSARHWYERHQMENLGQNT
ncbi:hypothetical protein HMI54_014217, partial [Coelomomyces lativittatus]